VPAGSAKVGKNEMGGSGLDIVKAKYIHERARHADQCVRGQVSHQLFSEFLVVDEARRVAKDLPVHSGLTKGEYHPPFHLQDIAHQGACGKARTVP